MLRRGIAPATLVLAVVLVGWLVTGVGAVDIIRFVAYDIAFVALPGISILWAVRGHRSSVLVTIALGWPLGQVLEILAFSGTAAIGARGLFLLYPIIVIAPSAFVIWRRRHDAETDSEDSQLSVTAMWTAAGALSLGLIYIMLLFLPQAPLPSATVPVAYSPDFPFFIGLIAEVMHHWPPTSPGLYGVPLHYEWFVFFHMAAAAQVTHVSIATIALRLDYLPTLIVIGCQLLAVGRLIGRAAWVGVVAVAVVFLLGPLDLTTDASGSSPFFDLFSTHLWASWTMPFGLMFFLALLYLISERLTAPTGRAHEVIRSYALLVLLMVGASGAKATILPVIITGVGLYAVVALVIRRKIPINAILIAIIGVVIFVITFLVVYGGGVPGTKIEPLASLARTIPVTYAKGIHSHTLRTVAVPLAYAAGLFGMLLPLVGMLYLLRRRHRHEISSFTLLLCMLAVGVLIGNVVHQVGYSELYFQDTGYVAGCIVAAAGFRALWLDAGDSLPISRRGLIVALGGSIVLLIAIVAISSRETAHDALITRYVGLAVGCAALVVVWAVAMRARRVLASGTLALALVPLLAAAALASPIEASPAVRRVLTGAPLAPTLQDPQAVFGLTPGLLAGLQWLRDHVPVDAVFAVSNHWINPGRTDGRFYYYSAFSERQVFIEAYDPIRYGITTGLATPAGVNFAYRERLNDAVFTKADAGALAVMVRDYAVRYLFVDRVHSVVNPDLLQLGRMVFSNADATIVAVG